MGFEIPPRVRNIPGWIRKAKEPKWKERPPLCLKYIDDSVIAEKVNLKPAPLLSQSGGKSFKSVNPPATQGLFDRIVGNAQEKGMQANKKKTGLLCVSGAISFQPGAHLMGEVGGDMIKSSATLKLLGFVFNSDGTVKIHARLVKSKLRSRTWALDKLKRCGLTESELLHVYWFPSREVARYESRHSVLYNNCIEYPCHTERCYASPMFFFLSLIHI